MVPEINYWAVLLATASSMIVGSIWYSRKVFGNRWAKLANVNIDRPGPSAVMPIVVTVIVSFVTAWVLAGATAIAWHFYSGGYLLAALGTAIILWAGFTAARFITHDAFEGRPTPLTMMNIAHEFVTIVIMAVIIGLWPPTGTI
jgi:protein-S-isoprenylcysteine O-methyltransferase Ste14